MYRNTDHWLQLVRRKLPLTHWFSLEIHVIGAERRAQDSHGYNLTSTPGQAEPIAQHCFKTSTTGLRDSAYSHTRICIFVLLRILCIVLHFYNIIWIFMTSDIVLRLQQNGLPVVFPLRTCGFKEYYRDCMKQHIYITKFVGKVTMSSSLEN